jgi:AraC family transcriptional regulator
MSVVEQHGAVLRDYIHLKTPTPAVVRALRQSKFAVTHIRSDEPDRRLANPIPNEDTFILSLQRTDFIGHELLLGGRPVPVVPYPQGMMSLLNLALDPTPYPDIAFDCGSFYLRRDTFDRMADDLGGNRIDDLAIKPGVAVNDPVVANLGPCLLSAIERPEQVNTLFVDHVVMALHTHLAQRYGGMRISRPSESGRLTPWQLRLARDTISAHLGEGISVARMARDCGLSVSHFARAFARSTGASPHRWLTQRRVDRAKALMRTTTTPLAEIALACGFSDQGHLTRVFSRAAGTTPGRWRRVNTK